MANWGKPDYDIAEVIDYDTLHDKIRAENNQAILRWNQEKYPVQPGYSPQLVQKHCVQDTLWQRKRLEMKGKPTHHKLEMLEQWWDFSPDSRIAEIQVGNYLGALRRGGQLNADNIVRKYI